MGSPESNSVHGEAMVDGAFQNQQGAEKNWQHKL